MPISLRQYILVAALAALSTTATAAQKKSRQAQCIYWFGFCTSCEAPLTCENSRFVPPESVPAAPQGGSAASKVKSDKVSAAPDKAKQQRSPAHARRTKTAAKAAQKDFAKFKAFMRGQKIDGRTPSDDEIRQMYARYRMWQTSR